MNSKLINIFPTRFTFTLAAACLLFRLIRCCRPQFNGSFFFTIVNCILGTKIKLNWSSFNSWLVAGAIHLVGSSNYIWPQGPRSLACGCPWRQGLSLQPTPEEDHPRSSHSDPGPLKRQQQPWWRSYFGSWRQVSLRQEWTRFPSNLEMQCALIVTPWHMTSEVSLNQVLVLNHYTSNSSEIIQIFETFFD